MRGVKVKRVKRGCTYNVNGKVIHQNYSYVIALLYWFKKPRYLRLRNGWWEKLNNDEPCDVELTSDINHATSFRDETMNYMNKETAELLAKKIKDEPDKFILY